ncbi:T9SS type A sorting domain-containing protein [Bacteroidota bacterium]
MGFRAAVSGSSVLLAWSTLSETDNAGFSVEQATAVSVEDWSSWKELGFVDGNGTTDESQTYQYRVGDLSVGTHRFRLKQVDFDGAFEYSDMVEASVEVPGEYVLEAAYPNPFNPTTTIRFAVSTTQHVVAQLYDASGRIVRDLYSGSPEANEMQTMTIDATALASGTYQVRIEGERFSASEQIMLVK